MDRLTPASDVDKASSAKIPLGRMGRVRDIADATVYLFSDAGSYVNGDVLIGNAPFCSDSRSQLTAYAPSGWRSVAYWWWSSRTYVSISRVPHLEGRGWSSSSRGEGSEDVVLW